MRGHRTFKRSEKCRYILSDLRLFFSLPMEVHIGIFAFLRNLSGKLKQSK